MSAASHPLHQATGDAFAALGKASPPLAVTGAMLAGISLQTWVAIATLVYVLLQAAHLVWKWVREAKAQDGGRDG